MNGRHGKANPVAMVQTLAPDPGPGSAHALWRDETEVTASSGHPVGAFQISLPAPAGPGTIGWLVGCWTET